MIRTPCLLLLSLAFFVPPCLAAAQPATQTKSRTAAKKKAAKKVGEDGSRKQAEAKPDLVGTYGSWGAYTTSGKNPTCYVLSQPEQRAPDDLKRDPAYVFISTRPAEHVRDEISIVMGFDVKDDGSAPTQAEIGKASFGMIAKGSDLWLKDDSQDGAMLEAMRRGAQMTVKAASMRGNVTTDSYSLSGLSQALEHALKNCK